MYLFLFIGEDSDNRLRAVGDDIYDSLYFFVGRLGIEAAYILYQGILCLLYTSVCKENIHIEAGIDALFMYEQ